MNDLLKYSIKDLAINWATCDKMDNCTIDINADCSLQDELNNHIKQHELWSQVSEDDQDEALELFRQTYFKALSK